MSYPDTLTHRELHISIGSSNVWHFIRTTMTECILHSFLCYWRFRVPFNLMRLQFKQNEWRRLHTRSNRSRAVYDLVRLMTNQNEARRGYSLYLCVRVGYNRNRNRIRFISPLLFWHLQTELVAVRCRPYASSTTHTTLFVAKEIALASHTVFAVEPT